MSFVRVSGEMEEFRREKILFEDVGLSLFRLILEYKESTSMPLQPPIN